MKDQFASNPPGFSRLKRVIESTVGMGIEIIENHLDALRIGISDIDQPAHLVSKIDFGTIVRHGNMPPACQWFEEQEEITGAVPFVFIIIALYLSRLCGQWSTGFFKQLPGGFVKAYQWTDWIAGS